MDLSKLTKEEKLAMLSALEEKERRSLSRPDNYAPNAGQLPVHLSKVMVRAVFTGNGGGKTALGVNEALWAVQGYNPITKVNTHVPARIVVVLDRPDKVDQVWLPELRKWTELKDNYLQKQGKPYYCFIQFPNGSSIRFMFHDAEPLAFESIECDFVIFDEPPPRHVYIGLRRGGRTKGRKARYLLIGTPISAAWMRKEIYEPWAKGELKDTECFRFGTSVNEDNLADGYVESFSSILSEKEKRIRLQGEFFDLDGLALAHLFKHDHHILRNGTYVFDKSMPCVLAIDPHPSKNHVAILVGADKHGPVYLKEISRKQVARDFAITINEFIKGYRVVDIVCDNLGSSEMTGGEGFKSFIQVLQEAGLRVRPTRYDEKVDEDWIERLQTALVIPEQPDNFGQLIPKLRIIEGNNGIVNDIETVQWAKYKNIDEFKPTLDIGSKDYLACLKYALASNITVQKGKDKVYYRKDSAYGVEPRHRNMFKRSRQR